MDFRKIFFGFALLIFGSWGFGQGDSTVATIEVEDTSSTENYFIEDFNVYTLDLENSTDSLYSSVKVHFNIKDSAAVGSIHIELALIQESEVVVMNYADFTLLQIQDNYITQTGMVEILLGDVPIYNVYQLTIMISSAEGMTDRVLTKIIAL